MGEQIPRSTFDRADYERFRRRLDLALALLSEQLARPGFGAGAPTLGAEVEVALVDEQMRPAAVNRDVLARLDDAVANDVSLELDRFCLELDTPPSALRGRPFSTMGAQVSADLAAAGAAARSLDTRLALVGTLPTARLEDLDPARAITSGARYEALAAALTRARSGDAIRIVGRERLEVEIPGIAAEGMASSLQVHLRVDPDRFASTMNAAHLVCAPVLGTAANSPFVLGRSLWAETRIPLFRQVVDGTSLEPGRPSRASLAHGWVRHGPLEVFAEDVALHEPLLPISAEESGASPPGLHELRLHGGTVWRWNRPVYDPRAGGHIRIEMRCLPSGPTVADMMANAAFLVGATLATAERAHLPEALPFQAVLTNLDAAARDGLEAELLWPTERSTPRRRTLVDVARELLPRAHDALVAAGVEAPEVATQLEVIERRLDRMLNGARWQQETVASLEPRLGRERALVEMLRELTDLGEAGEPVATWPIRRGRGPA